MSQASVGVIRNPRSGRGAGSRSWPRLEALLREALGDRVCAVEETTAPGSARAQAERMARDGIGIVAAAGGDGTVSDVMQGLLGSDSALAILPLGTGNDFARTIGVGPDPRLAVRALADGRLMRVDVGSWRQGDRTGYFLNVAGCGFDAVVAERINTGIRRLRGKAAYFVAILQTLRAYRPTLLEIEADGERFSKRAMLCAIANARSYGGGMKVAPTAEISDGELDLVLVGEFRPMEFLFAFPRVLKGTHLSHPKVWHRRFKRLEIESDPPVPFLVDGELLPPGKLSVEVVPMAIDVIVGSTSK